MTKLADEACDLFKGMPKSQHQNKLEQRIETEESHDLQKKKKKKGKNSRFYNRTAYREKKANHLRILEKNMVEQCKNCTGRP